MYLAGQIPAKAPITIAVPIATAESGQTDNARKKADVVIAKLAVRPANFDNRVVPFSAPQLGHVIG